MEDEALFDSSRHMWAEVKLLLPCSIVMEFQLKSSGDGVCRELCFFFFFLSRAIFLCVGACERFSFHFFLAASQGVWDLSSPSKDRTYAPRGGGLES